MKKILFFLLFFLRCNSQIKINEFLAINDTKSIPGYPKFEDWIELYNTSSSPINLNGYFLSDGSNKTKFLIQNQTIPANGFLFFVCSGYPSWGTNHTNFTIAEGDKLGLYKSDTTVQDTITVPKQRVDISYGRNPSNLTEWKYIKNTTINAVNNFNIVYNGILSPPSFSHLTGIYSSPFSLSITHSEPTASIFYTNDSSIPVANDLTVKNFQYKNSYQRSPDQPLNPFLTQSYRTYLYNSPINIQNINSSPNRTSMHLTSLEYGPYYAPTTPVKKATVIRAVASKPNWIDSDPVTNSYFFDVSNSNLPIVSINIQENHLFDHYIGISTPGQVFQDWRNQNPNSLVNDFTPGNYFMRGDLWEYPASFELIENSNIYKQNMGVRINGGSTRSYRLKSLRLYSRSKYGASNFNYPLFNQLPYNSYENLILHSGGQDQAYSLIKDATIHNIALPLDIDCQDSKYTKVFINGDYWGIENLRPRIDKSYFKQKWGVDEENLDKNEGTSVNTVNMDEGDDVHWNNLQAYLNTHSLDNQTYFDSVAHLVDIHSFVDYNAVEIYFANLDWINNNVGFWRERVTYSPNLPKGRDGKWRFYLYDIDSGSSLGFEDYNILNGASSTDTQITLILNKLLQNAIFKRQFINRMADLMNSSFLPSYVNAKFSSFASLIQSEIPSNIQRWIYPFSVSNWQNEINKAHSFNTLRHGIMYNHMYSKFALPGTYNLTLSTLDTSKGFIKINSLTLNNKTPGVSASVYPWVGKYFNNVEIELRPINKPGFKLKHWKENGVIVSTDSVYKITPSANRSVEAVFESAIYSDNLFPIAANLTECGYSFIDWPATSLAGTFPNHMAFVYFNDSDPKNTATIAGITTGGYALTSQTRINGLGSQGVAFINTGAGTTFPGSKLGGAILALNTTGLEKINISFKAGTVVPNLRQYLIKLQARLGDLTSFSDVLDNAGNPVVYYRNATAGHEQIFENIELPSSLLNQPYIQLFWKYNYIDVPTNSVSGARDQLRIDDIKIVTKKSIPITDLTTGIANYGIIDSKATITIPNTLYTTSKYIELLPGFKTTENVNFTAIINTCNN